MTKPRERALEILREHGPLSAASFARLMWPDSIAWKRTTRRHDGKSGAYGGAQWMSAGAFLSRMRKDGLVYQREDHQWEAR